MNPAADILAYLAQKGYGTVGGTLQTRTKLTMTNSPVYILAENTAGPAEPFHLERADTVRVTLTISAGYGERGAEAAADTAMKAYSDLLLLSAMTLNGTEYLHLRALGPPTESTFGTATQYSFTIEMIRYLEG
ncbi:MAG: hypothetical protein WC083_07380 [Candidatus Methanomethylophilaceae archaeon]